MTNCLPSRDCRSRAPILSMDHLRENRGLGINNIFMPSGNEASRQLMGLTMSEWIQHVVWLSSWAALAPYA